MAAVVWGVVGGFLALLLLAAWLMDRQSRRHGARTAAGGDIWREVRESRRDAQVIDSTHGVQPRDISWTSWSRRNRDGR